MVPSERGLKLSAGTDFSADGFSSGGVCTKKRARTHGECRGRRYRRLTDWALHRRTEILRHGRGQPTPFRAQTAGAQDDILRISANCVYAERLIKVLKIQQNSIDIAAGPLTTHKNVARRGLVGSGMNRFIQIVLASSPTFSGACYGNHFLERSISEMLAVVKEHMSWFYQLPEPKCRGRYRRRKVKSVGFCGTDGP